MKEKKFVLLLVFMFILGIMILICPQKETSTFERRNLNTNNNIKISNFATTINDVLNDQFPIREACIQMDIKKNEISRNIISSDILLKIKDNIIHLNNGYYINDYYYVSDDNKQTSLNRGYNIKEISNKYPDVKVYVYFPTRIEETTLLDNDEVISAFPEVKWNFISQLGDNVTTSSLSIESIEDYYKYFYKTDLHWNGHGSYQGYKDIINMMKCDFNIGEPKNGSFTIYPNDFYGSYATKLAFNCEPDYLIDVQIDVGSYDYYINNEKSNDDVGIKTYRNIGNVEGLYSDYEFAYGANDFIREYDFHQEDKPNLLIFSDSYVNPIKKAIASHFNKTVIVDLRANDGTFSLDKIIKDNNIEAILFVQAFEDLYFNGYLFVPLN